MKEDFIAVVEAKRFLGREFLTWLVYHLEEAGGRIERDGDFVELALGDQVALAGGADGQARLTLVDAGDLRPELGVGLRRGKLVDKVRLAITRHERRWEVTVDGGLLTYDSMRCPPLGDRDVALQDDPRAGFENDLFLRLADVDDAVAVLDGLLAEFCRLRASSSWRGETLPALRAWVGMLGTAGT
jgi:recombination associated protein RdgC